MQAQTASASLTASRSRSESRVKRLYRIAANLSGFSVGMLRLGLIIVLLWIGVLKFASYEADSIVPLVANSPFASFLYHHRAPEYRKYMNREGDVIPEHRQWQESNGTYAVSYGLGVVIVILGLLIGFHPFLPQVSAIGSLLLIGMCFVTLSFLVTTPEAWVPAQGDVHHGFPYLSGVGRLVVKDCIMLGAALVTISDSARAYLNRAGKR